MKAVLVDTSAWVDYFRDRHSPHGNAIAGFIEDGAVCTTGVVVAELASGARSARQTQIIKEVFSILPFLDVTEPIWWQAGEYRNKMKRRGFTAGIPDTIIAAAAIHYNAQLYSLNRHFKRIADYIPLEVISRI